MPMTAPGKFDSNGAWDGFRGEIWQEEINVRDFIQKNYTPYDGDEAFLTDPTDRTQNTEVMEPCSEASEGRT